MDGLMSFGKQAYKAYQDSESNDSQANQGQAHQGSGNGQFGIQGSSALNSSDNNRPSGPVDIDGDDAVAAASNDAGGDSGLFSQAMSFINQHKDDGDDDVDEEKVQAAHNQAYGSGEGNAGQLSAGAMGAAAAMQALKSFTSGGEGGAAASSSGGSFQSKLIGRAMSEAAKLFDQNGGAASGDKQDVVSAAGQMVMKLLIKNQVSGMVGGGSSGGLGSLMGMAQQFMK